MISYAAEMAETPEQAKEQYATKHPDKHILNVRETTERDKNFGLGYYTDEEKASMKAKIDERYRVMREEDEANRKELNTYTAEEMTAWTLYNERRATEDTQNAEGLHVGDILYTLWGYEQTNITFYQIIKLKGKHTIVIRRIENKTRYNSGMSGETRPIRDSFITSGFDSEPHTVRCKLWDYGNKPRLYAHVRDNLLDPVEFGNLYSCSCYG